MSRIPDDVTINLDSSSSLEFDRRMIVQESADSSDEADLERCTAGRHHCDSEHREILQQPFQSPPFRGQ